MPRKIDSQGDLIFDVEDGPDGSYEYAPYTYESAKYGDEIQGTEAGDIVFRTGRQERARIKADGTGTGWGNLLGGLVTAPAPSGDATGVSDTAVLNALMADGAAILLGAGTYWVNAALTPTTHCALIGRGQNITTIKRAADISVISAVGTNASPLRNLRILGMTIDGNSGQGYTSTLVQQSYLRDPVMRDVTLFGAEGIGLDQLEVWDFQSDNLIVSSCGGNSSGALPAHRIRCSTTDTSNNIHLRGYRNESFGADGAILTQANGSRTPVNIVLTDYKIEKHNNAGIVANFQQVVGLHLVNGDAPITGGLASGVTAGVDLWSFPGCEDVRIAGLFVSLGAFSASDVRSIFNFDGSSNSIANVTLSDITLHQGTGSQPLEDIRFAGTVNGYAERGVTWSNISTWTQPHWAGAPSTLASAVAWPSTSLITGGTGKYFTLPGTGTTASPTNGTAHATPFLVGNGATFVSIGCNVTSAGTASVAVTRLGIYADNGKGYPGALVVDGGTVASDATGFKTATISQALAPGLYWLVAVTQGAPTGVPTYTAVASHPYMLESTFTATVPVGFSAGSVTGSLAATFATGVSTVTNPIRLWLGT